MKPLAQLSIAALLSIVGGAPALADVFHAAGMPITTMTATTAGASCTLAKGTKFDLAPSPASSASAPLALVSITAPAAVASGAGATGTPCPVNVKLTVTANELDSSAKYEEWTIGGALIPFKYYASGDKGVASNATAIGYLGYKWHAPGGGLIFGMGAGPATISVPNSSSSSGTSAQGSSQVTGASVALLMLGQLGYQSTAQFGLAIGQDRVSKSANWVNSGKTWIGFQIGAKIY